MPPAPPFAALAALALPLLLLLLPPPLPFAAAALPPPGCSEDDSQPLRWICYGMELTLRACNMSDSRQHFYTADDGGKLQHYYGSGPNAGPGEAVTGWSGSDYGWRAALSLQPLASGLASQSWWEGARHTTDDTIISNVQNTSAGNISAILGCLQWQVVGAPTLAAGAKIEPVPCSDLGVAGRSFSFDGSPDLQGLIAVLTDPTVNTSFSGLCVAIETAEPASLGAYNVIDDGGGANYAQRFDGVGAQFSKGGARLLLDYPPDQQREILDFLFTPGAGASLAIALLEIGGDGQAVDGATPSHQHASAAEAPNVLRGTQGWLAQQARLRNPAVQLYWLPYSFPGWLGAKPFADPAASAAYVVAYLAGLQAAFGNGGAVNMTADVVGLVSDQWDAATYPVYVAALRAALDAAGMQGTRIACADSTDGWQCATRAMEPGAEQLLAQVGVFAGHQVPAAASAPFQTGKTLWRTYADSGGFISDMMGAAITAYNTQAAALAGLNAVIHWGGVSAVPDGHPEAFMGLVRADDPWSGHYYVTPKLWAVAHTSAFAQPGWMQLKAGAGSGALALGGSYVSRAAPDGSGFSVVCIKLEGSNFAQNAAFQSETATFTLRGRLLLAAQSRGSTVHVYQSNFGSSASGNVTLIERVGVAALYQPEAGGDFVFSVFLGTNTITTISLDSSFAPLETAPPTPRAVPQVLDFDFTQTGAGARAPPQPAAYLIDVNGAFEIVDDAAAGRGLQQMAAARPATRFNTDTVPHAVVGDEAWTDLDATASVWMPTAADGALLGVRCSGVGDGKNEHISGMDALPGLWLSANLTHWRVANRLDAAGAEVAGGVFAVPLAARAWHSMRLVVRGARLAISVDSILLAMRTLVPTGSTPRNGFAAIGATAFGARPIFGSLALRASATTCSAAPQEGHKLVEETCEADSGGQRWAFVPVDAGTGLLQSGFNASLCIACNRSSDPEYRYKNTRAGFVALCNASDARQRFSVEGTVKDGPYSSGPITGPDGLTLNIFGSSRSDNVDIAFYPWQGSSNAYWTILDGGLVYAPFYGTCLSACDNIT